MYHSYDIKRRNISQLFESIEWLMRLLLFYLFSRTSKGRLNARYGGGQTFAQPLVPFACCSKISVWESFDRPLRSETE